MKTKAIRKLASMLLTAALISGAACAGGGQDLYAYAASTWDAAEGQTLTDAIASADAVHTKQQTQSGVFDNFKKLLNENTAETATISQKEVESLLSNSGGKNSLTYKEAVSDVNLYFKALKYGYGAYEYFGGDTRFNKAKKEVLGKLEGKKKVSRTSLTKYLQNAMRFVIDGHFAVEGMTNTNKDSVAYQYYYDYSHAFSKDAKGYYKVKNGKKWYYKSCTTKSVSLQKTLTPSGKIVYSPVLFCKKSNSVKKSTITLVNGKNTKKETVNWKEQKSFSLTAPCREPDFKYLEQNGAAYISVRNFDWDYEEELSKFTESGASVQNASMIIFDIRSNGGGSDSFAEKWVKNFTGEKPVLNRAFSNHLTALNDSDYGKEVNDININTGYMIKNNIPIIVLVDNKCGSAGETMLLSLRSLENVIVIGGNSYGAQLCGNMQWYKLPNSGMNVAFGRSLGFACKVANVDNKGYTPDIWCNPSNALKAVTNMLKKQNYISADTSKYFMEQGGDKYNEVCIKFVGSLVPADSGFGRIGNDKLDVVCNGKTITDYTVVSSDSSKMEASRLSNGKLSLKAVQIDEKVPITITYKGKNYVFYANS